MTGDALLLAAALAAPLAVVMLAFFRRVRWLIPSLVPLSALPVLVLAIAGRDVVFDIGGLFGMRLGLDATARLPLLAVAIAWSLVSAHAVFDPLVDIARVRFAGFCAAAMFGSFGAILAQHVEGFHFFFAVMVYAGYGLVVHTGSSRARHAAKLYLVVAVIADAALVVALLSLTHHAGSEHMPVIPDAFLSAGLGAFILVLVALGARTGIAPLHVPLLRAARAAPVSASAALFGPMAAVAIVNWLKFLPVDAGLVFSGTAMAVAGLATTALAWWVGWRARGARVVLAYAGMGQAGYALAMLGLAANGNDMLAAPAVGAFAGVHALMMVAFFLSAGLSRSAVVTGVAGTALVFVFVAQALLLSLLHSAWPLALLVGVAAALLAIRASHFLPAAPAPPERQARRNVVGLVSVGLAVPAPPERQARRNVVGLVSVGLAVLFVMGAVARTQAWWVVPPALAAGIAATWLPASLFRRSFAARGFPVGALRAFRRNLWAACTGWCAAGINAWERVKTNAAARALSLVPLVSVRGSERGLRQLGVAGSLFALLVLLLFALLATA